MIPQRLRRRKPVSHNAVNSELHEYGLDSDRAIVYALVAGTMMIVATLGSLIVFILSVIALLGVYGWYPLFVAQQWFIYDELFTVFSFLGLVFGALATALMFSERSFWGAVASGIACTLSGAGVFVVSLIQPMALLWQAISYYFLPLFMAPLIGTLITYTKKAKKQNETK
jgi:hypothetical protein